MVTRRGFANIGCLGWILIIAVGAFLGSHIGAPYMRYYRFRDAVDQQARFATFRSDDAIRKELWAAADSIGLPESAYHLNVERTTSTLRISGAYNDEWEIPRYIHVVHFVIDVENPI